MSLSLEQTLALMKKGERPTSVRVGFGRPVLNLPHKLILTGKKGSNGKILIVRCKCMAEFICKDNYFNYDPLGEASTLTEALKLYDAHREKR
jgi:hypothetical protein